MAKQKIKSPTGFRRFMTGRRLGRVATVGGGTEPTYQVPSLELTGKWVAWSKDGRVIASGDTLENVRAIGGRFPGVSYEKIPRGRVLH